MKNLSIIQTPTSKPFLHFIVTSEGEIYNTRTGEKKYTWLNKGRESLYERVQFWIDGKKKNFYVHRLVAMLFSEVWDESFVVNHLNGDSLDNRWSNLQIGNQSINMTEAYWMKEYKYKNSNCVFKIATVNAYYSSSREI